MPDMTWPGTREAEHVLPRRGLPDRVVAACQHDLPRHTECRARLAPAGLAGPSRGGMPARLAPARGVPDTTRPGTLDAAHDSPRRGLPDRVVADASTTCPGTRG